MLHKLKPAPGSRPKRHIVGRGEGSGLGQTAGKGQKGQSSRSGDTVMNGFEGGQTPMIRRIPKRGFTHVSKVHYEPVNVGLLEEKFEAGAEITGPALFAKGILQNPKTPFKILSGGKLTKSFKFTTTHCSKTAKEQIAKAGGSI